MTTEYTYRFTSVRKNSSYWQTKNQVQHGTEKKILALVKYRRKSEFESIKVERAPIGEWEDVTDEYTTVRNAPVPGMAV